MNLTFNEIEILEKVFQIYHDSFKDGIFVPQKIYFEKSDIEILRNKILTEYKKTFMNEKKLQLVRFEQAKRLKEAGFDWRVILLDNEYSFPTVALALKWFRDVKEIKYDGGYYHNDDKYRFYYGEYKKTAF